MLLLCLNLAFLPCAMALEVAEEPHDCCPPTIELQQSECCELDDLTVDQREGKTFDVAVIGPTQYHAPVPAILPIEARVAPPPDAAIAPVPIYIVNCVFLK